MTGTSLAICRRENLPRGTDPNLIYYVIPQTLSETFGKVSLADEVGGVMAWKLNLLSVDNNGLDFYLLLKEQCNFSTFYSDGKNTTLDVPCHVVYVNNWVSQSLEAWSEVFFRASSAGVNYILLGFYGPYNAVSDTITSWQRLSREDKEKIKKEYSSTRLLLSFGGPNELIETGFISDENAVKDFIEELVRYAKKTYLMVFIYILETEKSLFVLFLIWRFWLRSFSLMLLFRMRLERRTSDPWLKP